MGFEGAFIPYGAYWSTPFCRWQGSFGHLHALKFGADIATQALSHHQIPRDALDGIFLGTTVPQQSSFYGAPWGAGLIGVPGITGPTISPACATSGRVIANAAMEVELGTHPAILALLCDNFGRAFERAVPIAKLRRGGSIGSRTSQVLMFMRYISLNTNGYEIRSRSAERRRVPTFALPLRAPNSTIYVIRIFVVRRSGVPPPP